MEALILAGYPILDGESYTYEPNGNYIYVPIWVFRG